MPPGVGYPARRAPMLSDIERRRAAIPGRSDMMRRPTAGPVAPLGIADVRSNIAGGLLQRFAGNQSQTPWNIINPTYDSFDWRDPAGAQKLYEKMFGADAARLREVDPGLLEALTQRSVAETGARQRAALGGLRSSAAGAGPGQFGFLAALSDIQAGSDLSRASSDAYLGEAERARGYREREQMEIQDFFRQQQQSARDFEQQAELARLGSGLAERRARAGRKRGISLGFPGIGGGSVSFQGGGVATEPTRAIIGDAGEPEYVLRESQLLDLLAGAGGPNITTGRDLLRARMDAAAEGVGTLGGGPRMGQDVEGLQEFQMQGPPEPPIPYREPAAVKPQGFWESLTAYMPEVSSEPGSSGGTHALALLANIARIPGATSMRRRVAENERTKEMVKSMNARQAMQYDAELDRYRYDNRPTARRASMERSGMRDDEVYIPELDEFVKKGGTVHNRYLTEKLMKDRGKPPKSPKAPAAPKRSPGLSTAIAYWKKRILGSAFPDIEGLRDALAREPDSVRTAPELIEAIRLRAREFGK